nr:hypothetical protein [Tanacetum cinerariifolium]
MQRFLRLAGFLRAAAGTTEEQAKNFQWAFASLPLTTSCVFRLRMWLSPEVPLRATPIRSALRVDADTQESVIELLVPASSVVKL